MIALNKIFLACSVCFGDPNSKMTEGLTAGILTLLGILFPVLLVFTKFFLSIKKRSKLIQG